MEAKCTTDAQGAGIERFRPSPCWPLLVSLKMKEISLGCRLVAQNQWYNAGVIDSEQIEYPDGRLHVHSSNCDVLQKTM